MTHGVLGIVACPMVDDNLVYSLAKDPEEKDIVIVENKNTSSITRKLDSKNIRYRIVPWSEITSYRMELDHSRYTLLIHMTDLGLHARPEVRKSTVEEIVTDMQPFVDAVGLYLGTCGNFDWNIPRWCEQRGFKPSAMFCDKNGNLCHDCVGINIAGGPKYKDLQMKYTGHLYVFPAMATNFDEFMNADSADSATTEASLTPEMREALGIEEGRDGYLRWLLGLGGYEHILRIDTGIGDRENFEKDLEKVAERTHLKIKDADEGWADLGPTDALYDQCKGFLVQ